MIFWTVVFITYYMASLVKGDLFYNVLQRQGELNIKYANVTGKEEKKLAAEEMFKASWKMLLAIPLVIALGIYLFSAINVDVHKYPSIVMLFYVIFNSLVLNRNKKSKCDLTIEEGKIRYKIELEKMKRYTFKRFIINLIYIGYFGYMFYLLVLR